MGESLCSGKKGGNSVLGRMGRIVYWENGKDGEGLCTGEEWGSIVYWVGGNGKDCVLGRNGELLCTGKNEGKKGRRKCGGQKWLEGKLLVEK